ncbi:hypothetical protein PHYPSEUDO_002058 [Phytophthora pseudosyringae]|uniref:Uncharacterized protein n=1 Tax=Phytophthora pseudosyringae TaxID=221518 RepID=A0A8T1VVM0_9STRA|nr:hypothetical protein PHYPSEUDO_002058 [Phytophthora pseudosyringae]
MASSSSSNGSSSLEADVTNVSTSGDSCTWYAGESCEKPRTCYDCLNVGIVGDSCAVGDTGQCLSRSEQMAGETNYLASSTTYCESADKVCTTCRARWLEEYAASGEVKSSAVCSGENECICLAACERESRDSLVILDECPAFERAKAGSIMLVAMGAASFIVFSMLSFCMKKLLKCAVPWLGQRASDQQMLARQRPPMSHRGPQLSLSGWKSMREKLIETEHGNGTPSAGPAGVMRIQLSAAADSTEVIVEEGEGYRPASPSEQYRAHRSENVAPALAMLR